MLYTFIASPLVIWFKTSSSWITFWMTSTFVHLYVAIFARHTMIRTVAYAGVKAKLNHSRIWIVMFSSFPLSIVHTITTTSPVERAIWFSFGYIPISAHVRAPAMTTDSHVRINTLALSSFRDLTPISITCGDDTCAILITKVTGAIRS